MLPTKVHLVKAVVFPVVMYGCESWTVKKAERRRIDAFELWCWRRLLRVPWTARRYNQSIRKVNPECSLEGLLLKLKPQYFGHLMWRVDSLEKTLRLGGIGGRRRRGQQKMRWLECITDSMDMSLRKLWELVMHRETWHDAIHGVEKNQTRLSDWNEMKEYRQKSLSFPPFWEFQTPISSFLSICLGIESLNGLLSLHMKREDNTLKWWFFFSFGIRAWGTCLSSFFTFPICFKCWTTI